MLSSSACTVRVNYNAVLYTKLLTYLLLIPVEQVPHCTADYWRQVYLCDLCRRNT
jgi:hypothetical protein